MEDCNYSKCCRDEIVKQPNAELYKMIGYSGVIRDLIQHAETNEQREQIEVMVDLFKNRFKQQSTLIQYVDDICTDIYKIKSSLL